MAQRFVRCSLCGLPHPAEETECAVHQRPIVPAARVGVVVAGMVPAPAATLRPGSPGEPRDLPPRIVRGGRAGDLVGTELAGRYRVTGVLARGGMGVVYEGLHLAVQRTVAIKVMHPRHAADPAAHARFQQEAAVAGSFGHPNIVEVFDAGTLDDGVPFMVMERLRGETVLHHLRRTRPLALALAVDIARQTLQALVATHARGILHRDLKPENLFLVEREGRRPRVKVLDFGVSRALQGGAERARLTRAGYVMGTPAYMAPEQARGDTELDARVDLYALGTILYEMLTGRLPFAAPSPAALLVEIQRAPAVRSALLRPEIPADLDALVARCLACDRAARPRDATTMLRELLAVAMPEQPGGPPAPVGEAAPGEGPGSQAVQVFARQG